MFKSTCICRSKSSFTPRIVYRHETVFKAYEGNIIASCIHCGTLKTFPAKKNRLFDPVCTKASLYEEKAGKFEDLFRPIIKKIIRFSPSKKILDVGCSTGILLSLLKKEKFDVYGIEPNKIAYAIAKRKFGNRIFSGTLSSYLKKEKGKFDCVVYNHVLEHVPNITGEFRHIEKTLRPGGLLVVGVPNTANFIFGVRRKFWESLLPNEHVWHLNTKGLIYLLEKEKYRILDISFNDDARKEYPLVKRIYFGILSLLDLLFHTGEAVLIIAQKKG